MGTAASLHRHQLPHFYKGVEKPSKQLSQMESLCSGHELWYKREVVRVSTFTIIDIEKKGLAIPHPSQHKPMQEKGNFGILHISPHDGLLKDQNTSMNRIQGRSSKWGRGHSKHPNSRESSI